jgi:hypothetical protein
VSARDETPWPYFIIWRGILLLALIDALGWGVLGTIRPGTLASALGMEPRNDSGAWQLLTERSDPPKGIRPPRDAAGLWQLLAFISLAQAGFLALAVWRPRSLGDFAIVPLIGHALGTALWLWALGSINALPPNRVTFPNRTVLWSFAGHEAIWLPLLIAFLIVRHRHTSSPRPSTPGRGVGGEGGS